MRGSIQWRASIVIIMTWIPKNWQIQWMLVNPNLITKILLNEGAKTNARDLNGKTAYLAVCDQVSMMEMLLVDCHLLADDGKCLLIQSKELKQNWERE